RSPTPRRHWERRAPHTPEPPARAWSACGPLPGPPRRVPSPIHAPGWACPSSTSALRRLGHSRQIDLEGGAVAQLTVDRGEAESRAPPRLLGREKRLEQPRLGRPIHAHARVALARNY